jgi:hypothetical protein
VKYTLKDYQEEAVREILANLRTAAKRWHEEGDRHAFSLAATTGAGKTVMAAAVFEALFHGDDDHESPADPGAVVIWFSDDPALNEQTRFRLREASERLESRLDVVQSTFNLEKFEAGNVYFLNTQKLGKNSLLTRGHNSYRERITQESEAPGDARAHTIWATIQNTIYDPHLTLYFVLDEAHRGMGSPARAALDERGTIVKRLINGNGLVSPIPIVWGISATIERFRAAMQAAEGRSVLPNVIVNTARVQESGLLKDTVALDVPDEAGRFDTVLVRRATEKLKESTSAWTKYAQDQEVEAVRPLMVLQVPNTPDPNEIGRALQIIYKTWPEMPDDAVAHVLGNHSKQSFGGYQVPYIAPERVQDSTEVRVLIAKDAISTGWDCPRAEVLVSFRPARDRTHITQLLGRMVRSPLARRIPGNERLNSVDCLLPFFDADAVTAVADVLLTGEDSGDTAPPIGRVLINPVQMTPNPSIPEAVWEKFLSLPSQSLPKRWARPVKRLTALAHELASDELLPGAGKKAHDELHRVLEAAQARYAAKITAARRAVLTVEGKTIEVDLKGKGMSFNDFVEEADHAVIEDAYQRARRILNPDVSRTYAEHLAAKADGAGSEEEALVNAHADIAALALVPEVKEYLNSEADNLAKVWLDEYRVAIKNLSDERQQAYLQIREMSTESLDIDLTRPRSWMEATVVREPTGEERALPTREQHLLCDSDGNFPVVLLNDWEEGVLDRETSRAGFVAWYRNPSRASGESLAIAYQDGNTTKVARPDFIFFNERSDGSTGAIIVDPHGLYLSDALPKLRGLAQYAERHASVYQRIEAVAKIGDKLRVLDLTDASVRKAVAETEDAKHLYESHHASDYR